MIDTCREPGRSHASIPFRLYPQTCLQSAAASSWLPSYFPIELSSASPPSPCSTVCVTVREIAWGLGRPSLGRKRRAGSKPEDDLAHCMLAVVGLVSSPRPRPTRTVMSVNVIPTTTGAVPDPIASRVDPLRYQMRYSITQVLGHV